MLSLNQPKGIFLLKVLFSAPLIIDIYMPALFNIFETFFVEELSIVAVTLTRQGEIGVG